MRARISALALAVALLPTWLMAAQGGMFLRLLACWTVVPDTSTQTVMQFERETFPPFAETGLFQTEGVELLYIEEGVFTLFSDRHGEQLQEEGYSLVASPGSSLFARNDDFMDASVLWLRLTEPFQIGRFVSPATLPSLVTTADVEGLQPLFIEFEMPEMPQEKAHLFIAEMGIAPGDGISEELITSGRLAIVVEQGQVEVSGDASTTVLQGEWTTLDFDQLNGIENTGDDFAQGFVVGLVEAIDAGYVNKSLIGEDCPS